MWLQDNVTLATGGVSGIRGAASQMLALRMIAEIGSRASGRLPPHGAAMATPVAIERAGRAHPTQANL
jgi:hypothetical protein